MGSLFESDMPEPTSPVRVEPPTMMTVEPDARKAKIDMEERLRRVKASHQKSKLTLPSMFGEAETVKSTLKDTLG